MSNEKERLSLRVSPVTSYRLHTAYRRSGCRSMNELAEKASGERKQREANQWPYLLGEIRAGRLGG